MIAAGYETPVSTKVDEFTRDLCGALGDLIDKHAIDFREVKVVLIEEGREVTVRLEPAHYRNKHLKKETNP